MGLKKGLCEASVANPAKERLGRGRGYNNIHRKLLMPHSSGLRAKQTCMARGTPKNSRSCGVFDAVGCILLFFEHKNL